MTALPLCDARAELGEGPSYDPASDAAWWVDITGQTLLEHRFADGSTHVHALPRMASLAARIDADRQLLAMENGLYVRTIAGGALRLLTPLEADNSVTRSNDGRVHPSGALWIGTMGKNAEKAAGAIYWARGAEVQRLFADISIPNAICFSPDGGTGFFADTARNTIWRVALDPATGLPRGAPEVFVAPGKGAGWCDGAVMDQNGVLWNAAWGGAAVNGYGPDGALVRTIPVPARQPSCPCFVGPDASRMIVTTARQGMDPAARAADPGGGLTFALPGVFDGIIDPPFAL
ncbi:MAG: sugar lactone lactonase YvrE [Paracoccaceae bacterium]|jgi:sugar lactone lactonase YvrE